jgi:hypothetical protein
MRILSILALFLTLFSAAHADGIINPGAGGGSGSGTVTSIATGCQATGGTITTTGTISTQTVITDLAGSNPSIAGTYCGGLENLDNSSAQTPTIAVSGSGLFVQGWYTDLCNINTGAQTLTPASGTIGGASTYVLAAGTKAAPKCVRIISDAANTNYVLEFPPSAGGGSGNALFGTTTGNTSGDVVTMSNTTVGVQDSGTALSALAPLANPTFTGTPAAPTPGSNVNTTQIPTSAWVNTYFGALAAANAWTGANSWSVAGQNFSAAGTAAAPTIVLGECQNSNGCGLYSTAAGNAGFSVASALVWDYAITTSGVFTASKTLQAKISAASTMSNAFVNSSSNAAGATQVGIGNNTNAAEFSITTVSSANATKANATYLQQAASVFEIQSGGTAGSFNGTDALDFGITAASAWTLNVATYASCTALTTNSSGTIGCTGSDPRLKNIDPIPYVGGLDGILKIVPITFRGKEGNPEFVDTRHQAGFNCWNVRDSLPMGTHNDAKGYCNLDPDAIIAGLVNAVEQQQSEIEDLKRRVH